MISITIIGTGNVATHLFRAFQGIDSVTVAQVIGRTKESLKPFKQESKTSTHYEEIEDVDIYIITVSDAAIKEVSEHLSHTTGLVVHTSGAMAKSILQSSRKGVFYPLQTFTKGKTLDFSTIPICIEAENQDDYKLLEVLGKSLSPHIHHISSDQRKTLHLAAVFVNNFTNHMFYTAKEICETDNINFDLLKPLITETVEKIRFLTPEEAQTGPAVRNDVATMQRHLDGLENSMHKKIYQIVSESIRAAVSSEQ